LTTTALAEEMGVAVEESQVAVEKRDGIVEKKRVVVGGRKVALAGLEENVYGLTILSFKMYHSEIDYKSLLLIFCSPTICNFSVPSPYPEHYFCITYWL
jgi:hypothetical protein